MFKYLLFKVNCKCKLKITLLQASRNQINIPKKVNKKLGKKCSTFVTLLFFYIIIFQITKRV